MKKKLLSAVLTLTMIVSMMPYGVFAAIGDSAAEQGRGDAAVREQDINAAADADTAEPAADQEEDSAEPAESSDASVDEEPANTGKDASETPDGSADAEKPSGADTGSDDASGSADSSNGASAQPESGETGAAGASDADGDSDTSEDSDTSDEAADAEKKLSVELDASKGEDPETGITELEVSANNDDSKAHTVRLYFWDYDKSLVDKDQENEKRVSNFGITVKDLKDDKTASFDNKLRMPARSMPSSFLMMITDI